MRRVAPWLVSASLLLAACDSPEKPVTAASVTVSPASANVVIGTTQQLTATVLDGKGRTLTNRPVSWAADKSSVLSVSTTGLVTAVTIGTATVSATADGRTGTAAITVVPVPVASVTVTPANPVLQPGSTRQLVADVRDERGNAVTGRGPAWSSANPSVASVSGTGLVTGVAFGSTVISASIEGRAGSVTVTVAPPPPAPEVTDIAPVTLVPGAQATITGTGFGTGDSLAVTIGDAPAAIVSASPTQLVVTVPCLRTGAARVQVRVGERSAERSGQVAAARRALAPGQSLVLTEANAAACNELVTPAGAARYLVAVYSAARAQNQLVDAVLEGNAPGATAARVVPQPLATTAFPRVRDEDFVRDSVHGAFLERERATWRQLRLQGFARATPAARAAPLPALGDMKSVFFTFTAGCQDQSRVVRAKAIYIGTRAIIWEDSTNTLQSAGDSALASYYRRIGTMFDLEQYDVVRRHFGDPLQRDLDGDGRVHMVFTQRVNGTGAAAYVTSCDQLPTSSARGSNVGEYFYGGVPTTPNSNLASFNSPDGWFYFMGRTVVHEVKHISSMAWRVASNAPTFEESWLEEGTARHAEELWVREAMHRVPWKGNAGWGTAASNGVYCDFHPSDATCNAADTLRRPGYGMRRQFNEIRDKLVQPWNWSPYGDGTGQSGSIFYQTTWSLVRYAIDRYASSEPAFFQALTQSQLSGTANLANAAGAPIDHLVGGWGLALYADDYPGVAIDADARFATWNLRDIYSGLNSAPAWAARWPSAVPIVPTPLTFGAFVASQGGIRGGSHAYFELSGTATGSQLLHLHGNGDNGPAPFLRLAVVRLQ